MSAVLHYAEQTQVGNKKRDVAAPFLYINHNFSLKLSVTSDEPSTVAWADSRQCDRPVRHP